MKRKNLYKLVIAFALLLASGRATHVAASPLLQAANLLQNPGFDEPYNADGSAHGWQRWHNETGAASKDPACMNGYHFQPIWSVEFLTARFIQGGSYSQHIGMQWDTWKAGMFQTITVKPGSTYRFSAYGQGRSANEPIPMPSETSVNMNMQVGIDPNGSGLWYEGDVVWSGTASPHDRWQQFSIEVVATGDKITVFTAANWGVPGVNQCRAFLDTWWDTAELVEVAPPPTATSPPPPPPPTATTTPIPPTLTPTAAFTATSTPIPTDTPTATPEPPEGGTICINAFADENANGVHDSAEGYMASVTFTVASAERVVGQAVSYGNETPVCFDGLVPGSYQVAQILPGRLEMTTAANAVLPVEEGMTYGVEFGSRISQTGNQDLDNTAFEPIASIATVPAAEPEDGAPEPDSGAADSRVGLLALSGLLVMALAVILLGVLIFLVLRRQAA
jgi:hypothetical protein